MEFCESRFLKVSATENGELLGFVEISVTAMEVDVQRLEPTSVRDAVRLSTHLTRKYGMDVYIDVPDGEPLGLTRHELDSVISFCDDLIDFGHMYDYDFSSYVYPEEWSQLGILRVEP